MSDPTTRLREALAEVVDGWWHDTKGCDLADAIVAAIPEHRDDVLALLGEMEQVGWWSSLGGFRPMHSHNTHWRPVYAFRPRSSHE